MKEIIIEQDVCEKLMKYDATDYGNGLAIKLLHGDKFCFVPGLGLMFYNGKFWDRQNASRYLYAAAINTMKVRGKIALDRENVNVQKCTGTDNRKVNNAIQSFLNNPNIARDLDKFNVDKDIINVDNGVLNLKTLELKEHSPSFNFTYCCNVKWNPQADSSFFLNWLSQCLAGYERDDVRDFLQMCLGYTITGHTREEKMFYIWGKPRSGKGTLMDILHAIMGKTLAGATKFETFTKKRDGNDQGFDLAPLSACRFVSASESNKTAVMNESAVKNITGNDPISAAHKNQDIFHFQPLWKIWVISNFKPKGDVSDDAFWSRFIAFEFPNSRLGEEDTSLKGVLTQPENLEGAFKWMVLGAQKWYNQVRLTAPDFNVDLINEAREELDLIKQWMDDECVVDKNSRKLHSPTKTLYDSFDRWCSDNGHKAWEKNPFSSNLIKKGFESGKEYYKDTDATGKAVGKAYQKRGYYGIEIKNKAEF